MLYFIKEEERTEVWIYRFTNDHCRLCWLLGRKKERDSVSPLQTGRFMRGGVYVLQILQDIQTIDRMGWE